MYTPYYKDYTRLAELVEDNGGAADFRFWMSLPLYRRDEYGHVCLTGKSKILECRLGTDEPEDYRVSLARGYDFMCHIIPVDRQYKDSDTTTVAAKLLHDFQSGFAVVKMPGDVLEENVVASHDIGGLQEEFLYDRIRNIDDSGKVRKVENRLIIIH